MTDNQIVLDALRKIVQSVRSFSKITEKQLGLSTAQIFILQKLDESKCPLSINELASATFTHQSSVSVVVSKLVQGSLVKRSTREADARCVELEMTKKGAALLAKSPISIQDRLIKGLSQMTSEERHGLVVGLQRLISGSGLEDEPASMLMEDFER